MAKMANLGHFKGRLATERLHGPGIRRNTFVLRGFQDRVTQMITYPWSKRDPWLKVEFLRNSLNSTSQFIKIHYFWRSQKFHCEFWWIEKLNWEFLYFEFYFLLFTSHLLKMTFYFSQRSIAAKSKKSSWEDEKWSPAGTCTWKMTHFP